jgi:hypothetical protein
MFLPSYSFSNRLLSVKNPVLGPEGKPKAALIEGKIQGQMWVLLGKIYSTLG